MKRALIALALVACHKETKATPVDAGADVARIPAPNSPLARELGADDAGRGTFRWIDDGPGCGPTPRVNRDIARLGSTDAMEFRVALGPAPKQGDEDALSPIQLAISAPAKVVRDDVIEIKTTLTNRGKGPFTYQKAMDGSMVHWTSPFVDVYVKTQDGVLARWVYPSPFARCGNVDPRTPADFVTLKPREQREQPFGDYYPKESLRVSLAKPGTYTLWVVYAACQGPEEAGNGTADAPKPDNLFEGNIASNALTIEVTPPP